MRAKQIAVLRSKSANAASQSHHDAGLTIMLVELSRERHFDGLLVFALNSGCA